MFITHGNNDGGDSVLIKNLDPPMNPTKNITVKSHCDNIPHSTTCTFYGPWFNLYIFVVKFIEINFKSINQSITLFHLIHITENGHIEIKYTDSNIYRVIQNKGN